MATCMLDCLRNVMLPRVARRGAVPPA